MSRTIELWSQGLLYGRHRIVIGEVGALVEMIGGSGKSSLKGSFYIFRYKKVGAILNQSDWL